MGLFSRDVTCPYCGDPGARKSLFGGVKCPNRGCGYFDVELMQLRQMEPASSTGAASFTSRSEQAFATAPTPRGNFVASRPIEIRYTNFRGEAKTFRGDRRSLRKVNKHFSLRVEPTGQRIALDRDRIGNLAEVEQASGEWPSPQDERVLNYHTKRGSTSALFEQLKQKYPQWTPSG